MHPRDREALYNSIKRYLDGEKFTHFDLRILVSKLLESEQETRRGLADLEQEHDELFNQKNAIPWQKYDPEKPPEVGKTYLVHRIDGSVFSAVLLFDVKHERLYWEQKDGIALINNVTHYAELNRPDPTEGFEWFKGDKT